MILNKFGSQKFFAAERQATKTEKLMAFDVLAKILQAGLLKLSILVFSLDLYPFQLQ